MERILLAALTHSVLSAITPTARERAAEKKMAQKLLRQIRAIQGMHVGATWAGSSARDTHVKNDRDLDIFVQFPHHLSRGDFEREGLELGRKVFSGHEFEEAYSEHPYIRGTMNGFDIEIVPTYAIEAAHEKKSSVDRSVFHHAFVQKHLRKNRHADVRLLKQFLKGIRAYGAETAAEAVPGYLTELLIIHFGSFAETLKAMAGWKPPVLIDIAGSWNPPAATEKFNHHLVVVDPVDANRNVAAALSLDKFSRMIMASRLFLAKPSKKFFFPPAAKPLSPPALARGLSEKEIYCVAYPFPKNQLGDIVWGQARRLRRKLATKLEASGFSIRRAGEWTDEKNVVALWIEVESAKLADSERREGPFVWDEKNAHAFLSGHAKTARGPRIENGRLVVEKKRAFADAGRVVEKFLFDAQKEEHGPLAESLARARIASKTRIRALNKKNKAFQIALGAFVRGRDDIFDY